MILNTTVSGILAIVLGYLIGSFPSAYVVTRISTGKDIRKIGTGHTGIGNVGTRNVFVNVGRIPGITVALLDILKGVGVIYLAQWLVKSPGLSTTELRTAVIFVFAAGLAAVIGHIWPVYIKFRGGAGLATTLGILAVIMPQNLLLALILALVMMVGTRNVLLSVNLSLVTVPIWAWFFNWPWWAVIYPLIILALMLVHFLPNIVAEIKKAGNIETLVAGLLRRNKPPRQ